MVSAISKPMSATNTKGTGEFMDENKDIWERDEIFEEKLVQRLAFALNSKRQATEDYTRALMQIEELSAVNAKLTRQLDQEHEAARQSAAMWRDADRLLTRVNDRVVALEAECEAHERRYDEVNGALVECREANASGNFDLANEQERNRKLIAENKELKAALDACRAENKHLNAWCENLTAELAEAAEVLSMLDAAARTIAAGSASEASA